MPQSLSCVLLHVVFSTKNRDALILPDIESELFAYMSALFNKCGCPATIINGTSNHVHALCSLSRTISIAKMMQGVKASSSAWVKSQAPAYRNFQWQDGYAVFSIGRSNETALVRYIATQKEHHRKIDFKVELRTLFKKYRVHFDEQYVWD